MNKKTLTTVLIGLALADLLGAIDATGVNIALPKITRDLNIPIIISQWIPNAYTLVLVTMLIFMGKIGDMIGPKKLYIYGLILFGLSSLALGFTNNIYVLISIRSLQGLGTAILYTMPMSIIAHLWHEREKAFAVTASFFAGGMLVGPIIGGTFTNFNIGSYYGWHLLFLINVPLIIIGLIIANKFIPDFQSKNNEKLDYLSLLLLFSGLIIIILSLSIISKCYLILGLLLLLLLFLYEKSVKNPLLEFGLFKNITFTSANLVSFFIMIVVIGMSFVLTFYLQDTLNWSSFQAGLGILPVPIVTGIIAAISGKISNWKLGGILSSGLTLIGIIILTQINPNISYYKVILPGLVFISAGSGIFMTIIFAAILGSAPTEKSGSASGILNTLQQLGGLIGIALVASIVMNYKLSLAILLIAAFCAFISSFFIKKGANSQKI